MELWQIWCIAGVGLFILEIFTPLLFFMNLAIACFFAAIIAALGLNLTFQVAVFGVLSAFFLLFLRPILTKQRNGGKTGIEGKYIGKIAIAVQKIDKHGGRIKIYGEEWQAQSLDDEVIEIGSEVTIIRNESLMMFVKAANRHINKEGE